jgi:hypothetical protein
MGRGRFWLAEEIDSLRQLAPTVSTIEIAQILGRPVGGVRSKMIAEHIKGRGMGNWGHGGPVQTAAEPFSAEEQKEQRSRREKARIERMMHLAANIERLRTWKGKAA